MAAITKELFESIYKAFLKASSKDKTIPKELFKLLKIISAKYNDI